MQTETNLDEKIEESTKSFESTREGMIPWPDAVYPLSAVNQALKDGGVCVDPVDCPLGEGKRIACCDMIAGFVRKSEPDRFLFEPIGGPNTTSENLSATPTGFRIVSYRCDQLFGFDPVRGPICGLKMKAAGNG